MIRRDDTSTIIRRGLRAKSIPGGDEDYTPQVFKDFDKRISFSRFIEGKKSGIDLQDSYKGISEVQETPLFIILSGPSLNNVDLKAVADSGIITLGVNNSWAVFVPDMWTCVDPPKKFLYSGWADPSIIKFVPERLSRLTLRRKVGKKFEDLKLTPKDCANTFFYPRNSEFDHETFLRESSINWGQSGKTMDSLGFKGGRSVMLAALKLAYVLGFRRIYLLGCDFQMKPFEPNYAFKQDRTKSSVKGNNRSYEIMRKRFEALKPQFDYNGFTIMNCNPDSNLESFDHISVEEAIKYEESRRVLGETTGGWYDGEEKKGRKMKQRKRRHEEKNV